MLVGTYWLSAARVGLRLCWLSLVCRALFAAFVALALEIIWYGVVG